MTAAPDAAVQKWKKADPLALRILRARRALRSSRLSEQFQGESRDYDAFSIHLIANACEEALADQGVIASSSVSSWSQDGNKSLVVLDTTLECVDRDERRTVRSVGEGVDQSDKGFGKATSYARKNGFVQALNLGLGTNNEASNERAQTTRPSRTSAPAAPGAGYALILPNGSPESDIPAVLFVTRVVEVISAIRSAYDLEFFGRNNNAELTRFCVDYPERAKILTGAFEARRVSLNEGLRADVEKAEADVIETAP